MLPERGLLDPKWSVRKAWVLEAGEEFSLCRCITGRGSSSDKKGQSPETVALGGFGRRRSLWDVLLDLEGGERGLWEDCRVSQAQRQEQRREFWGWRSPTLLG